ncbi:unnamed protein product [Diamesa hyperborea]
MGMCLKFVILLCIIVQFESNAQQIDFENGAIDAFIANGTGFGPMPTYIASIRLRPEQPRERFNNGYICTAIFITREHLITVASCISQRGTFWDMSQLSVTAGTSFRTATETTITRGIRNILLHPGYSFSGLQNNIAIVFLDGPLSEENGRINPMPLEFISSVTATVGSQCAVMGWARGRLNESIFIWGNVTIINNTLCTDITMNEGRVCAGPDFIRACQYDDGGPLICNGSLFGLIDYKTSDHCTNVRTGQHDHYINIATYHSWIMSVLPIPVTDTANHTFISYLLILIIVGVLKYFD